MIDIDVTDYRRLAFKHINALPRAKKVGLEEGDLLNAAYTGIWLASKAFNKDRDGAEFTTFCYWYIQRELTNLKFRQTTVNGKTINVKRDTDYLYDDLVACSDQEGEEWDAEGLEALAVPVYADEEMFVKEFLDSVPLEGDRLALLRDLYEEAGDADFSIWRKGPCRTYGSQALANYISKRGCSRQAANEAKKKVLQVAEDHYARLNR